jgi:hypothetical protein
MSDFGGCSVIDFFIFRDVRVGKMIDTRSLIT